MSQGPETVSARRFLVVWRDGAASPHLHAVGALTVQDGEYLFSYLDAARHAPGFRPFPGLGDLERTYRSSTLFLFFADRVMDRRRPEYAHYLRQLDLPADASLVDILGRSEGVMKGDRVAVVQEPAVAGDGATDHVFIVRGLRFAVQDPDRREALLAELKPGVLVSVRDDLANPVNPRALNVVAPSGESVGWVPDALVHYVRNALATAGGRIVVQRRNGPKLPPHIRLLVRVTGHMPAGVPPLPPLAHAVPVVHAADRRQGSAAVLRPADAPPKADGTSKSTAPLCAKQGLKRLSSGVASRSAGPVSDLS